MKKNRVYTVNSLLARISGNYKFWLIALPAVTMLAQALRFMHMRRLLLWCSKTMPR